MQQNLSTYNNPDRCLRCNEPAGNVRHDPILGTVYECSQCLIVNVWLGRTWTRPFAWTVLYGQKTEVIA